jgi:hypothetical protein
MATGKALTDALAAWTLYLALEPYARRVQPRYLVSWTRLLHGRVRDPLVGRDMLFGAALSTVLIAFWAQLFVVIPHALNVSAPPPPMIPPGSFPYLYLFGGPPTQALLGGRHVVAQIPAAALLAFGVVMLFGMVLLGLRLLLRRTWAAVLVFGLVVLGWPVGFSEYSLIGFACSYAGTVAHLWAHRYGLVSALTFWFCIILWLNLPVTMNWDAPYFGTGFLAVLTIGAIALYAAMTAARPRSGLARRDKRLTFAEAAARPRRDGIVLLG